MTFSSASLRLAGCVVALGYLAFPVRSWLDVYNLFNANSAIGVSMRYSTTTTFLRPTGILAGRFVKFGAQVEF